MATRDPQGIFTPEDDARMQAPKDLNPGVPGHRAVLERAVVHFAGTREPFVAEFPGMSLFSCATVPAATVLAVPVVREGTSIGCIASVEGWPGGAVHGCTGALAGDLRGPGGHRDGEQPSHW